MEAHASGSRTRGSSTGRLSLAGADLTAVKLGGADLREARLPSVRFSGADLRGARLDKARLKYARLDHALLDGASLFAADLSQADLSHARLAEDDFSKAQLNGADLRGASIDGCNWQGATFKNTKFDRSHVTDAGLRQAVGVSSERFMQMVDGGGVQRTPYPVRVIRAAELSTEIHPPHDEWFRFLAAGDSSVFCGPDTVQPAAFAGIRCPAARSTACNLTSQAEVTSDFSANLALLGMLAFNLARPFDAILVSAGGDDLFDAARTLPTQANGQPTPRASSGCCCCCPRNGEPM